jgi:glycosyltransferase involved in cell wall biosynthesis
MMQNELEVRPKLLFIGSRPPFPLTGGGRIRSHRLLTGLANAFETTFVTFEHHERSGEVSMTREELEDALPGVDVVTVAGRRLPKRLGQARSLVWRRSWVFGRYASRDLAAAAATAVREGAALVHFDDLGVALGGPLEGAVNIYSAQNVEQRIVGATAEASRGLRGSFAKVELGRVRREEERVWTSMQLCVAVSEVDAAVMRSGGARVVVCPNGTDPVDRLPFPTHAPKDPLRLLFVGSVDYEPNYSGLRWFIEEVLPHISGRMPTVLDVVGSYRRAFPMADGVVLHGEVPSVVPFYARAHVAIVPVLFGSGTRLKVIEAMALGRPVVATTVGAEGLPVYAGVHYFAADDAPSFAQAVLKAAEQASTSPGALGQMLDRARAETETFFWPAIVSRLVETYRAELERLR